MSNDGLEEIKLGRDYAEHKAGETIRRSPGRVKWLRERGFAAQEASEAEQAPRRGRRRVQEAEPKAPEQAPVLEPVAEPGEEL